MRNFILLISILFFIGCSSNDRQSGSPKKQWISTDQLRDNYIKLWESVENNNKYDDLLVQLGTSEGTNTNLWVLMTKKSQALSESRMWKLNCQINGELVPNEIVHDSKYGIVLLEVDRSLIFGSDICDLSLTQTNESAKVTLPSLFNEVNEFDEPYSFLAYSCNEPFTSQYRNGKTGILNRDISLWLRMAQRAKGEYAVKRTDNTFSNVPFKPSYVLGLGDQVYVDPDPKLDNEKFDLSAKLAFFGGNNSDDWFFEPTEKNIRHALSTVYRFNFALPPLDDSFSWLPAIMMWDDHEIRDGWGSQGDEHISPWPSYYKMARHSFIAHQYLRSQHFNLLNNRLTPQENYNNLINNNAPLHHHFSRGSSSHTLLLDGRSNRASNQVLDESAFEEVRNWLEKGVKNKSDLFILTTGTPFVQNKLLDDKIASTKKTAELDDDLKDGWSHQNNKAQQTKLMKIFETYFSANKEDRLLILSGDVHFSALFSLSLLEYGPNLDGSESGGSLQERIYGHEVITSGIAHALPTEAKIANTLLDISVQINNTKIRPLGKISESATFAEIIVTPNSSTVPHDISVIFHSNGTKRRVTNLLPNYSRLQDLVGFVSGEETWVLGNIGLANSTPNKPYFYNTYQYGSESDHHKKSLEQAKKLKLYDDLIGVGTAVDLKVGIVKNANNAKFVTTVIQSQSVFCFTVESYENSLASSFQNINVKNKEASNCEK